MFGISAVEFITYIIPALIAGVGLIRACDHFIPEEEA